MSADPYADVVVVAPVTVPYTRYSEHGAPWWFGRALAALVEASGIGLDDIDGLAMTSMTLGDDPAVGVVDHLGISLRWLDHVDLGGSSGVVAVRRAAAAVATGQAEVVACIGADTNRPGGFGDGISRFSAFSRDAVFPVGAGGPSGSFGLIMDAFLRDTGVERRDLGLLSVAQRRNAVDNPIALLRTPITVDDYLGSRPIADPVHLLDCVMPCAGAEAYLVMTRERAARLGLPAVRILASAEAYNTFPDDPVQSRGGWAVFADRLWDDAGVGPRDMHVVHTYDDYPFISAMQFRDLGFVPDGDLPGFLRRETFTVDGTVPHNTSGGQLSMGQAGFAGGYLGVTEVIRQLIGRPLGRQVVDARRGIVSGFGMIDYDRGLTAAAVVLETEDA